MPARKTNKVRRSFTVDETTYRVAMEILYGSPVTTMSGFIEKCLNQLVNGKLKKGE